MSRFSAAIVLAFALTATSARADEPIVGLWQVTWTDADTHQVVLDVWDV